MPSKQRRVYATVLMLSTSLSSVYARALWLPEEFDSDTGHILQHEKRSSATCPSDPSLNQCPSDLPPNFCCPPQTTCLPINTGNSSVTTAICCPSGQSCNTINPVSCNQDFQDATKEPSSQLHSIPPQRLDTCGSGCCPMGYSCNSNALCVAQVSLSSSSKPDSKSPPTSPASGSTSPSSGKTGHALANGASDNSSGTRFNGTSFAAGIIPGIALGAIIAALLILFCIRKRRRDADGSDSRFNEKRRDTLTDLGTLQNRPMMHGRSISEPTTDPSAIGVTRTDFLRSSPARTVGSNDIINNNYITEDTPRTPPSRTPRIKALFSRSPFMNQTPSTPPMTQPPIPAHLKRGTLSFTISPIRALRKQKSMHSLRRQMTESRTESTETIQVLMSPDAEPTYKRDSIGPLTATSGPLGSSQPQQFPYASSSRYPSEQPPAPFTIATPPPPVPRHNTYMTTGGPSFLDSPYTPTKTQSKSCGLGVPGADDDARRETTFSHLMEKAGLRKSELVMGTRKKIDQKFGL